MTNKTDVKSIEEQVNEIWLIGNGLTATEGDKKAAITKVLQERDRIAEARGREEERKDILKEMSMNIPVKSTKHTAKYHDGLVSGWYAAKEFIRQLTTPLTDNK